MRLQIAISALYQAALTFWVSQTVITHIHSLLLMFPLADLASMPRTGPLALADYVSFGERRITLGILASNWW
jgi:hypothetical protein